MPRVALFLDFENLYTTLKRRTVSARNPYGFSPRMDFPALVRYIEARYGTLAREDFIAVANFTHYNPQLGGLNRVATVIDAQSFMGPQVRRRRQPSHGKKWVIRDFADMRLAFEVGRHVATRPADIYILGSGDEAFTALGRTLRDLGFRVMFLVADTHSSSTDANILEEFDVLDFLVTQPPPEPEETPPAEPAAAAEPAPRAPTDTLVALVRTLRRRLSTAIPVNLVVALLGVETGARLLDQASGQGLVDVWDSPEGVRCVSLRQERVFGQVQKMSVRAEVAEAGRVFFAIAAIAAEGLPAHPHRAFWRQALRRQLNLSNRAAKALLERLRQAGVLHDAYLDRPRLNLDTLERFMATGSAAAPTA